MANIRVYGTINAKDTNEIIHIIAKYYKASSTNICINFSIIPIKKNREISRIIISFDNVKTAANCCLEISDFFI